MSRLPLVSPVDRMLYLKAQPYLEGVPSDALAALATFTEEEFHPATSWMRQAGGPVGRILFLAQGTAGVEREGVASHAVEAPGVVGLADHFSGTERPPGVRAVTDALVLSLDAEDLDALLEDYFPLLLRFAIRGGEELVALTAALGDARPDEAGFEGERHDTPAVLDLVHRLASARRAPLFKGANLTMIGELTRFDEVSVIEAGAAIWRIGEPVDRMALVLDGCLRAAGPLGSARAPAGAVIGAWEILREGRRVETWIAEKPSRVLWIRRDLFTDLLEDDYELASDYLRQQSGKIIEAWTLGGGRR